MVSCHFPATQRLGASTKQSRSERLRERTVDSEEKNPNKVDTYRPIRVFP